MEWNGIEGNGMELVGWLAGTGSFCRFSERSGGILSELGWSKKDLGSALLSLSCFCHKSANITLR